MKLKFNELIFILLLIISKFTPNYVRARETIQIFEQGGVTISQNGKQKLGACAELKNQTHDVEKINLTHKYQRWKRVPMFDCLQSQQRTNKLLITKETIDPNIKARSHQLRVNWVDPSNPFNKFEESFLEVENSTSSQVKLTKLKGPPVKYKVTAACHNMITPFYEEEPEFKAEPTPNPRWSETNETIYDNVLVINAPSNLGGLPVVVVTDKTNHVLCLSLKKIPTKLNKKTSAKYMSDYNNNDEPNKIDSLLNNNYYVSAQRYQSFRPMMVSDPRYNNVRRIEESDMLEVVPKLKHSFTGIPRKPKLKQSIGIAEMTDVQREINRQLIENVIRYMKKRIITRGLGAEGKIEIKSNKH